MPSLLTGEWIKVVNKHSMVGQSVTKRTVGMPPFEINDVIENVSNYNTSG